MAAMRTNQTSSAMRARMRKDVDEPSSDWDNEWQEISSPEDILISIIKASNCFRADWLAAAKMQAKDPMDAQVQQHPDRRQRCTGVAVFRMSFLGAAALGFGHNFPEPHQRSRRSLVHPRAYGIHIRRGKKSHWKMPIGKTSSAGPTHAPDRPRSVESRIACGLRIPPSGHFRRSPTSCHTESNMCW